MSYIRELQKAMETIDESFRCKATGQSGVDLTFRCILTRGHSRRHVNEDMYEFAAEPEKE